MSWSVFMELEWFPYPDNTPGSGKFFVRYSTGDFGMDWYSDTSGMDEDPGFDDETDGMIITHFANIPQVDFTGKE